jgi:hypothetical protein
MLEKVVKGLGTKVPKFIAKHPIATMTGGVLVNELDTAMRPMGSVEQLENSIMREYIGGRGAKYACEELAILDERKRFLATKVSFEKVAEFDPLGGAADVAGKAVAKEGISWIRRLIRATAQAINIRVRDEPVRQKIISNVVTQDPIISMYEQENPGGAYTAMQTMRQFAPTLSTNPAIVQAFLRNAAMSGGPMDYQTVKGLADAEMAVLRARHEGAWGRQGI